MKKNLTNSTILLARLKRRRLTLEEVNKFKDVTPPLKKGSSKMFRNLRDKGKLNARHMNIQQLPTVCNCQQ